MKPNKNRYLEATPVYSASWSTTNNNYTGGSTMQYNVLRQKQYSDPCWFWCSIMLFERFSTVS